jgi:hypothetical protein
VSEIKIMMYVVLIVFFSWLISFCENIWFLWLSIFVVCDVELYHIWLCFVFYLIVLFCFDMKRTTSTSKCCSIVWSFIGRSSTCHHHGILFRR